MSAAEAHVDALARIDWRLERTRGGALLATCEPLGLVLEADSEAEARSLIRETLELLAEEFGP